MKKFFKKPLNLVSFVLMVVGVVVMVALLVIPHGGKYSATTTVGATEVTTTYTFKGDKVKAKAGSLESSEIEYKIEKGKLKIAGAEVGKINAFKFTITGSDETYTCKLNVTIMVVACAMAVVGLAGTIYGSLTLKKKKK